MNPSGTWHPRPEWKVWEYLDAKMRVIGEVPGPQMHEMSLHLMDAWADQTSRAALWPPSA